MKIRVNGISKENKKVMVGRISEALGEKAVFLKAPSFAYQVGTDIPIAPIWPNQE